jgi:hypothetical protein
MGKSIVKTGCERYSAFAKNTGSDIDLPALPSTRFPCSLPVNGGTPTPRTEWPDWSDNAFT